MEVFRAAHHHRVVRDAAGSVAMLCLQPCVGMIMVGLATARNREGRFQGQFLCKAIGQNGVPAEKITIDKSLGPTTAAIASYYNLEQDAED